jgi:hypothetical protein
VVAFNCCRRVVKHVAPAQTALDALARNQVSSLDSMLHAASSHRAAEHVELRKDEAGGLVEVRIGRWRVIAAGTGRRLAEVRELGCQRVAVRIEKFADNGTAPSSEIWQLYHLDGRLEASMQTSPDGKFALLTNYRTRQACRLVANARGELQPAETWRI